MKKTTIRKITAALLCALLLLSAPMGTNFPGGFALTASAQSYSGTCGENLTWTLNTTTGILSITGTGEMEDYSSSDAIPWTDYRSAVREVRIADGITHVGGLAFYECPSLTDITIPDSVISIGEGAFYNCSSLTSIMLSDNITSIGMSAFSDTGFYNDESNWTDGVLYIGHHLIEAGLITGFYTVKIGTKCIAGHAFYGRSYLTSIAIPDSVVSIGDWAFYSCYSLTSVTIPDSVTSIGEWAFLDCRSLTDITIPNSVTNIGYGAFCICRSLTSITIPNGVTSIGADAFADCSSLNYVHIPASVTSIGKSILEGSPAYICSDTAECYAKEYAEANGIEFRVCKHSNSIISGTCGENLTWTLDTTTGILTISGTGEMEDYNSRKEAPWKDYRSVIREVRIVDGVTSIGNDAFASCTSLTNITIPNSVTSIGDTAFWECMELSSVSIPNSVMSIGVCAFLACTSLKNITIPDSVTSIGGSAFGSCSSLTSITIPDSVMTIGDEAFLSCDSLTSITVDQANRFYSSDSYGVLFDEEKNTLIQFPAGSTLTEYTIPNSVTNIGDYAFLHCKFLNNITIPNSVTSIEWYAFGQCSSLKSVIIPNSVTSIRNYAFAYCSSLNYVHIPDSVTTIGGFVLYNSPAYICSDTAECYAKEYAEANGIEFRVCKHSNSIISGTCGENLTWTLNTTTGILTITGTGEMEDNFDFTSTPWFAYKDVIRKVQIESGVTSIGAYAFVYCASLTNVTIPDSVTRIGYEAFSCCRSLTSITIPDSVTSIEDDAFYYCMSLTSITVDAANQFYSNDSHGVLFNKNKTTLIHFPAGSTLTKYTIPDSVVSIGDRAFYSCLSLTSISIPDSVITLGDRTFLSCDSLTSITVDPANRFYSSDSYGVFFDKKKTTLIQFPAGSTLTEYTIPNSVTNIGDCAFLRCKSLKNTTLPNSVTSIGDYAFCSCDSLPSIIIPDGVTSIGSYAFWRCSSLTSITIPNGVTSIGADAFADCSSLNYVHIPDSVTDIGGFVLDNSPAYICSDTAECYAKEYAEEDMIEFRVCDGHGAAEPEPPKFDGTTGTVQADCTPGCFDEDAHLVVSESDKTLPEFGITVSGYVQVQKTYNIQVQNAHGQPLQPKSGHTVTLRLPLPLDDHGNPYDAGKYSVYHLIDNDPANTESFRAKKGNLKIENGFLVIEVSHFSPFVVVVESEMPTVSIAGNPGTFTLRYNETLVLHAEAENLPDGASLLWEADKDGIVELKPSGDGTTCEVISKKTGDVRITVKVVDADGSEIEGSGSDTETVQSKAGFFQKLLAFFRLLFGIKVRIDQRKK